MKLAIIGSRTFNNYEFLENEINNLIKKEQIDIDCIISGGANGVDKLGELYADIHKIKTEIYYADWSKGKKAGFDRNHDIIKNSDIVICFWNGFSQGTLHSINLTKKYNKKCFIIKF